jgi:hypothetical protein
MRKLQWLGKRKADLDDEILWLSLLQRRWDTNGEEASGIQGQIVAMSDEEREALKREVSLPSLVLPHAPVKFSMDGIEYCSCSGCVQAIEKWRELTGRV